MTMMTIQRGCVGSLSTTTRLSMLPQILVARVIRKTASTTSKDHLFASNPLHLLQQECHSRGLCDHQGKRLTGVDWRIVIALGGEGGGGAVTTSEVGEVVVHINKPPNLRTVGIQQITDAGIDFVVKQGSSASQAMAAGTPISFLHTQGKFLPGQSAEQWRGEGTCVPLDVTEIIHQIPIFTLTSLVASKRLAKEQEQKQQQQAAASGGASVSHERKAMGPSRSHLTQLFQQTRQELETQQVSLDELRECLQPFRLQPNRVECMLASPDDSIMWDRWEWLYDSEIKDWKDPQQLVPH